MQLGLIASSLLCLLLALALAPAALARSVYVANESSSSVSVIDSATRATVGSSIPVGGIPFAIAITPDGTRTYVAKNGAPGTVTVIDNRTNTVVGPAIVVGNEPRAIAITPDGSRAYVANRVSGTLSVIDTTTNVVVGPPIAVGAQPFALAISPDGKRGYVTNAIPAGTVTVIDTQTNTTVGAPIPVGTLPEGIAVTPNGSRLYVANGGASSNVSVIDTQTNAVIASPAAGSNPFSVAIAPDGARAFVTLSGGAGGVAAVNTATNVATTIPVPNQPAGIAFMPDGLGAFVTNRAADKVSFIDTTTNQVVGTPTNVGSQPIALAITPDQPPSAAVTTMADGLAANFDGSGSSDSDGSISSYGWSFGDGTTESTGSPTTSHRYARVGEYTATLAASDGERCPGFVFTGQTASCNGSSTATETVVVATVKLGKLKRNRRTGTAKLRVELPASGQIDLSGKGVKSSSKQVGGSATRLSIRPKGKLKAKLNRRGSVKVNVSIDFSSDTGATNNQTKTIKLERA